MQDVYHDDLRDFVRNGRLDAYELTDAELARFLELWRWSAYTRRTTPSSPDFDAYDMVERLERHLYRNHNIEIEYNTRLLLRSELEAMMYMNVLLEAPRALLYFINPQNWLTTIATLRNIRRARRIKPVLGEQERECRGYPRRLLNQARLPRIDLLARTYWRQISPHTTKERIQDDMWW